MVAEPEWSDNALIMEVLLDVRDGVERTVSILEEDDEEEDSEEDT